MGAQNSFTFSASGVQSQGRFATRQSEVQDSHRGKMKYAKVLERVYYLSLSSTFIAKFLTLKDTEDSQSPPASLTQTALQNEPLLLANQFRLD